MVPPEMSEPSVLAEPTDAVQLEDATLTLHMMERVVRSTARVCPKGGGGGC